jgi:hypothetical protein
LSKSCQKVTKNCQKVVKNVVKKLSKKLSKSCQKVAKSSQKVDKKLSKVQNSTNSGGCGGVVWGWGWEILVPRPSASALLTGRRQKPKVNHNISYFG